MKKLFFVLLATIISVAVYAYNMPSNSPDDPPVCVTVGNVSATIDNSNVNIVNYNSYTVSVTWQVYGIKSDGTNNIIAEGVAVISRPEHLSSVNKYSYGFTKSNQYQSYSVRIQPQKCSDK